MVANPPLGGPEGVALTHWLTQKRQDTKVLVNKILRVFSQLDPNFIYTNPFVTDAIDNRESLKFCIQHINEGDVLF